MTNLRISKDCAVASHGYWNPWFPGNSQTGMASLHSTAMPERYNGITIQNPPKKKLENKTNEISPSRSPSRTFSSPSSPPECHPSDWAYEPRSWSLRTSWGLELPAGCPPWALPPQGNPGGGKTLSKGEIGKKEKWRIHSAKCHSSAKKQLDFEDC